MQFPHIYPAVILKDRGAFDAAEHIVCDRPRKQAVFVALSAHVHLDSDAAVGEFVVAHIDLGVRRGDRKRLFKALERAADKAEIGKFGRKLDRDRALGAALLLSAACAALGFTVRAALFATFPAAALAAA